MTRLCVEVCRARQLNVAQSRTVIHDDNCPRLCNMTCPKCPSLCPFYSSHPERFPLILALILTQLRSAYIGIAMMTFLHGYIKFTRPLLIQSVSKVCTTRQARNGPCLWAES
ncbi:hypothetical protein K435DRAFT_392253 [Dendrothele bispora CBS 962.96]|uniref:Uncharacterized protein n=1 Tax=Dendrothele bispora (strain CBS 962.96) TaxID=1314807 RepID=A0A4S8MFZ9_DENBC|nr:hypothetical protein K435DRAFT_348893 [Dendrothele bispora CBS 962.96]THV01585.1 hypothetical protein K435DRAFT_392253 [Dendrothele bispora CBS 962.96]